VSGENHSEKLHRNDRDLEFRPDIVSDVQKHVNNEHESPESEHDEATDHKAAKRMAKLARNGIGKPPSKDKQLAATDEVKAVDGVGKAPSKEAQQDALADFREVNEDEKGESEGDESGDQTAPTQQTSSEDEKSGGTSEVKTASKVVETEAHESEHEEQKDPSTQNGKPSRENAQLAMEMFREVNAGPSRENAQFAMEMFREVNAGPSREGADSAMEMFREVNAGPSREGANSAMEMFREVNAGPSREGANSAMQMFREVNGESEHGEREGEEKKSGKKKGGLFGVLKDALGIGENAGEGSDPKVLRTEIAASVEVKDAVQTKDENLLAPNKANGAKQNGVKGATNDKAVAQQQNTQPTNAVVSTKTTEPTGDGVATADHQAPVFLNPFRLALGQPGDVFEHEADRIADQVMRPEQKDGEHATEEQHEQELEQLGIAAQADPHGAQEQKQQVRTTALRQQQQVQQKTNAQAAKISTGGSTQAARRGSAGQKKIATTRAQGEQAQAAQRQAAQQKKVQKAKSIAELKTRLAESFKAKSEALKADVEAQRTELKTKLAAEKQKLADEIKAQDTKLAADVAKRNTDLEKKFADRKKQIETQNKAELDKAEAASKAEQQKVTSTGDAEARRIEAQGTSEAAAAKRSASQSAASIRARGRTQAASLRKEEGGESRADAAIKKADADAKAAEARGAHEAASKTANAHKMAEAARSKAASQVTDLKGKLEATRETLRKQLADAQAQADTERQQMVAEVQKFIDTAKKEMAVKTDESNVRINQLEKDSTARIDGIETQTKKKIQQQHDDLLIKLEGPNAAAQLATLDEETNKACAEIDKAVTQAQEGVKQEVADSQAAAARQTQERITAVQAEGKKAQDKIATKAAETERKIDEAIKQLELKNKAALEAQDRDTKQASGKAQEELKAFGDKSVGDLKKSTEQYEKDKAAEEAAAAAAKAAEEKKKADEEKARLAEEKRKQDEAVAAEKAKKEEFARKTQGAANELFDAMDGWGTNEKKVFAALRGKTPEEMQAIKDAYKARTGRSLDADLTAEMSGNDLKEAKALLSQDPVQSRVAALQNAMQGWGTDEKKVKETLASMTDPALRAKVIEEYEKQTGDRLSKALADEGMGSEGVKPDDFKSTPNGPVLDDKKVEELAKSKDVKLAVSSILGATDRWGTDEKAISAALKGKSPEEIAAIKRAFREHSGGKELDDVLEDELSGTELKEAKALMSGDPVRAAVAQLHNAADGLGTDKDKIHETLKGITDPELRRQVTAQYEKETGEKLDDMLEDELSGFDRDKAQAYAEGNKAKIAAVEADAAMHGGFMTDIADGMADTFGVDRESMRSAVGGAILGPYATTALTGMGVKVGTDFGTDNKALFTALEGCKDQKERDELIAAYRERTGRDLMTDVSADLEGKEKDVAKYIMAGDKASAEAAKMAAAADGMGTDRKAIFEALEKAESKAERDAMIAKYNELYGKDGETFEKMLDGELDELDKAKAQQLAKQGRMDDGFALYYAMNEGFLGIGTDDDLLKEKLQGKSKEDIETLKKQYAEAAKQYGGVENADLIEDVKGETSGRAGHELRQAMKGNPTTLEEMRQRLAEDYAFERTESGWVGNAAMFVMNPLGYGAMQSQGINSTTIANGLTDMWSGSGKRLDQTHAEIEERYQQILRDPRFANYDKLPPGSPERAAMDRAMMKELQGTADWQEGDLKAFEEAKDATADVASTAVTVAVGAVITIASGGTAAPAVVALISGLAGVSTKMLIKGGSMSNEEIVQETAAVIAEAAAAGVVKIEKVEELCKAVGKLTGGNNKLLAKIMQEAMEEAIESGSEEFINAVLDPELYKGDLADWAKGVSQRTGKSMAVGAFSASVSAPVGDVLPEGKTWKGRAANAATSQAVGSVASQAIDPGTYEGSQEEKLVRFGRGVGEAALRGARDSLGGGNGGAHPDIDTDSNTNDSKTKPSTNVSTAVDTNVNTETNVSTPADTNVNTEANVSTPVETSVEVQSSQEVTAPVTVANDNDISTAEDLALADAMARGQQAKAEADQKQNLEQQAAELEQAASNLEDEAAKRKADEDESRELAWQAHEAERARLAAEADAKRKLEEQMAWDERAKKLAEQKASEEDIAWAEQQANEALADNKPVLPTANDNQPAKSLIGDKSFKTDKNNDGVQDAARVGVDGTTIPNEIPRLPGLDEKQQAAEAKFAAAYERDPEALAREYLEMVMSGQTDKELKNFATDDAKLLSPDYNPADAGPVVDGQVDPKIAARGYMNIAVHQTANAVAKLAFTMRLDQIANDASSPKKILVTAGGVGAGKSFAIDNNPQATKLKAESAAVWDSAGEQNSTELPWVIAEAKKRGIEVAIVYVHRRPDQSWENMKFGVIPRAAKTGRMVDARLHADSYAEGARNFDAVQSQMANVPDVKFVVIDATGDAPVEIDRLPQSALELDAELVHKRNVEFLESKKGELPDHVLEGGNAIGEKIWGPATTGVETKSSTDVDADIDADAQKGAASPSSTSANADTSSETSKDKSTQPSDRIRQQIDEKGHSGIEIHSHFLGNVEPTAIRKSLMDSGLVQMVKGDPNGATASARVGDVTSWEAVLRAIAAYESKIGHKYQTDTSGDLVIDPKTNRPVIATRGISGDAMQQIREARARIEALKAELDSDDLTSVERDRIKDKIYREARSAAEKALRASDETDFNSSYEIRDELVKQFYGRKESSELLARNGLPADASWDQLVPVYREYFADRPAVLARIEAAVAAQDRQDPKAGEAIAAAQRSLEAQFAYDAYAKQALLRLAQDNLSYTEQSNSANKLNQRFDEGQIEALKRQLIAEHPDLRAQIERLDVKHVAMLNTNLFGVRDPNVDQGDLHARAKERGSESVFEAAVEDILQQTKRGDVVGVDIAGAEHFSMDATGQQRLEYLYSRLFAAAKGRGEPIVLRPHVGEGANDVVAGKHFGRDSDRQMVDGELSGVRRARENLEAMIVSFETIAANFGGKLPPEVIVRFGHATMTTPDQAIRMAKLGIIAEVNLTSNDQTGASARKNAGATADADGQRGQEQLPLHRPNPAQRNAPLEGHSLPTLIYNDVQTVLSTDAHAVMSTNMAAEYRTAKRIIDEVLAGRRPIAMTAEQASALGVEGTVTPTGVDVFLGDIPAAQRDAVRRKFEAAYTKLYQDANDYYDRRPKQGGDPNPGDNGNTRMPPPGPAGALDVQTDATVDTAGVGADVATDVSTDVATDQGVQDDPAKVAPKAPPVDAIVKQSKELYRHLFDNDAAFEAVNEFATAHPGAPMGDLAYHGFPDGALGAIAEMGLISGKARGAEGPNAETIWFKSGAPFYADGLALVIPRARLEALGGVDGKGLAGQDDIMRLDHATRPEGIPISEFAIVYAVGYGYVVPVYTPPGWKGPVGNELPAHLLSPELAAAASTARPAAASIDAEAKAQTEANEQTSVHTDTSGQASPIADSSFHGMHTDGPGVTQTDVTSQLHRLGFSLATVLERSAAGATFSVDGTTLEVVLPDGTSRKIEVALAPEATEAVASFSLGDASAKILVSPQARLADLERALAHEAAEIVALWSGVASNTGANGTAGVSAHDIGRLAELNVLLDQFQTAAQSTSSTNTLFGDRADLVNEVRALLADMDLPANGQITAAMEQRLGPVVTAQLRKLFFLSSPEFKSFDTGTTGGVVVRGTDTKIGNSRKPGNFTDGGSPGHVMATDMRPVEHDGYRYDPLTNTVTNADNELVDISALPAETRDALLAKVQHVSFGTSGLQLVNSNNNKGTAKVGTGELAPVRGMAPFTQTAMPGADLGFGQDKYLWGKMEGLENGKLLGQDFQYAFSPAFVQPEGFRIVESMWRAQQQNMPADRQSYVLATSSVTEGQEVGAEHRKVSVHESTQTVQARNCATSIVEVFRRLKTVGFDGFPAEKVLDASDFAMLGMNADGSYQPGRDLRPQDVYEHLRWKEADWRRRLGEAMSKNPALAEQVLAKLGEQEYAAIQRAAGL
jgi:hypothetical protein